MVARNGAADPGGCTPGRTEELDGSGLVYGRSTIWSASLGARVGLGDAPFAHATLRVGRKPLNNTRDEQECELKW
jgi:hypothetical protein